ncbi:hypothetical protein NBRC116188_13850 [Oceaniserpentilla sp. 4NH20-0058]
MLYFFALATFSSAFVFELKLKADLIRSFLMGYDFASLNLTHPTEICIVLGVKNGFRFARTSKPE